MNFHIAAKLLGLVAGTAALGLAAPAAAQAPAAQRQITVSKGASKAVSELQTAVNANDRASIPAKLAAAQAAAKTPDDRYAIAQLQVKAAVAAKDDPATLAGLQALVASGAVPQGGLLPIQLNIGKLYYNAKQYDQAATSLQQVLASDPNNEDAIAILAEARNHQGRTAEAVEILGKSLRAKAAAGQKGKADWYKRAVGLAYEKKLPSALDLSREWVAAYPGKESWQNALRIYRNMRQPDDATLLDVMRLARATNALEGEGDYQIYAYAAIDQDNAREAKALLDEATAAGRLSASSKAYQQVLDAMKLRPMPGEDILAETAAKALAAGDGDRLLLTADRYYGAGNYARAAELYRAALPKAGAKANQANLRLGMALARAGDKAGARTALAAVTGPQAEVAKYWMTYLATAA